MLPILVLWFGGCAYFALALWFALQNRPGPLLPDRRMESNFAGDVEHWLRERSGN